MQSGYAIDRVNINQMLFEPFFNNMTVILMFLLPLLTMRLFADEKKMRTEELLLTSPLRPAAIILGKYLAALIIYAIILLLTATYAVFVFVHGNPEAAPLLTAYLGLFLLGAVFIAIGLFASSLTENQVIAAAISFSAILLDLGGLLGRRKRARRLAGDTDLSLLLLPFQEHGHRRHRHPGHRLLPVVHFPRPLPDPLACSNSGNGGDHEKTPALRQLPLPAAGPGRDGPVAQLRAGVLQRQGRDWRCCCWASPGWPPISPATSRG